MSERIRTITDRELLEAAIESGNRERAKELFEGILKGWVRVNLKEIDRKKLDWIMNADDPSK